MNQIKYNIYRIPNSTPLLITLLDGSGSMHREYNLIVDQYQKVFGEFNDYYRLEYQLTQDLQTFVPYLSAGSANITQCFKNLLALMINQKFPKNITIILISDGREQFQAQELEELIKQVKSTYSLQFMSIAIGNQFPDSINNMFQKHCNNPFIQSFERSSRKTYNMISQEFFQLFNNIKNLLPEVSNEIVLNDKVKLTIPSKEVDIVQPGSVFLADKQKIIKSDQQNLIPSDDFADLLEIMVNSMQQALLQQEQFQSVKTEFSRIHQISSDIYEEMCQGKFENEQIQNLLNIALLIAEGTLDLQSLNEFQLENLQVALATNNLDKTNKIVSLLTNKGQDEQQLTPQIINLICSLEFKQLRAKSLKKSTQDQQGTIIQSCYDIVMEGLKKYQIIFTETPYSNFIEILKDFKDLVFKGLASVFDSEAFKITETSHLEILDTLNKIIGTIIKLPGKTTLEETLNLLRTLQVMEEEQHAKIQAEVSGALFDNSDDYKYLPKSVQLSLKDDSDLEPILIFIFDNSVSMQLENRLAQNALQITFGDTNRIELEWGNQHFKILQNQTYLDKSYNSLSEVFDELEEQYQLSNKRILLSLISDGANDYRVLHQQIKIAKLQKYYLKMIYFAVGGQFHIRIENDIMKKFQNQQVRGKPWLFKIPKKLKVDIYKNEQIQSNSEVINPFQRTFQDCYTKYINLKL